MATSAILGGTLMAAGMSLTVLALHQGRMDTAPTPLVLPKPRTASILAPLPLQNAKRGIPWLRGWQSHPLMGGDAWFLLREKKDGLAGSLQVWDRDSSIAGTDLSQTTLAGSSLGRSLLGTPQALGTGSSGDRSRSKGTSGRTSSRTSGPTGFARRLRLRSDAMVASFSVGTSAKESTEG